MDSIDDLLRRLEQLNTIGSALSKERDITRLLESILVAAKTITHADGGTLYRVTPDGQALRFDVRLDRVTRSAVGCFEFGLGGFVVSSGSCGYGFSVFVAEQFFASVLDKTKQTHFESPCSGV